MGAWGTGVKQCDAVLDVIGNFDHFLKQNPTLPPTERLALADRETRAAYADELSDEDDRLDVLLGLAESLWSYGTLDETLLAEVRDAIESPGHLAIWGEADQPERMRKLRQFLTRISTPRVQPKRLPKIIIRKPIYAAGDCLAVTVDDGRFTGAVVLAADHSDPEHGRNLLGELDYLADEPPPMDVFEARRWLRPTHHSHTGKPNLYWVPTTRHRLNKARLVIVGQTALRPDDPVQTTMYASWDLLGRQVVHQEQWDRGERDRPPVQ